MTSPSTIEQKFVSKPNQLGVVAVGFSGGQCKPGVEAAPTALIASGLLDQLRDDLGYDIHHDNAVHAYEDIMPASDPDHRGMKKPRSVSAVTQRLSQQVYEHAKDGKFVLTLGGDHSIAIGTISGTAKAIRERLGREMAVIWVDAHADINTPEMSPSGNVHGMPMAFLTGIAKEEKKDIFGWIEKEHMVSVRKLVYIGLRDVDRGEKQILRENGIKAFSMHDVDKYGIGRVVEMALAYIGNDTPIHLSFDVDALDPQFAPSTGTPVRGGLTLREGDFIAECVHETGSLVAMDLVEVNPSLETLGASETIRAGCSLVRSALGDTLLIMPFMVTSSALGVAFIILILILAAQRFLLPGIIIIGSFVLFVLWLTGLIETALQLYGSLANVNANCQNYVQHNQFKGNSIDTLSWLTQTNICNCWKTAFAFEVVNTVFFLWMMVMSWQVNRDIYD
ncbi:arginase [Paecilomyces variotii No. 5]|uniref:Arginase n=1 Tax=Byssochlamys spectabilis (strain No. 5 / NBRC 109023) TaxID=1356009 RepID=V5HZ07_BYSSN|nr:arginase [Paecilomyces variotii No. 5]